MSSAAQAAIANDPAKKVADAAEDFVGKVSDFADDVKEKLLSVFS